MLKRLMVFYYKKKIRRSVHIHMLKTYKELNALIKNGDYNSIIVGSSHGEYGIKASILSDEKHKFLNLCTSSQDLYRSYYLIKYVSKMRKIKRAIMTYSLFSNSFALEKTKEVGICYLNNVFFDTPIRAQYKNSIINKIKKCAHLTPPLKAKR